MAAKNLTVEIRVAWWLVPYLYALCFFCWAYRREPDYAKLCSALRRAVTIRSVRRPGLLHRVLGLMPAADSPIPEPFAWAIILASLFITAQHLWAFWKG